MPDAVINLVRHGMHDWLRPETNRFAGTLPGIRLNDQGRLEAQRLHEALSTVPLAWVASSPLERAMETAQIIIGARDVPISQDDRLIEWRCGPWEGMTVTEIETQYPEAWRIWHRDPTQLRLPDTEPLADVADRMEVAFRDWAALGGAGVLVSHRDPLAALLCRLIRMPLNRIRTVELPTGSLSRCLERSFGIVVETINGVALP